MFVSSPVGKYNAILMDVMMPVMDGYEATKAIRNSKHPEALTIPIVAMTANAFVKDVQDALDARYECAYRKANSYRGLEKYVSLLYPKPIKKHRMRYTDDFQKGQ